MSADTVVNIQLESRESVVFNDNVAQGDRISIELQTTAVSIDFYVLSSSEYLNWQNELSFSSVLEGRILVNSSIPKITDTLESGMYYVVLENPDFIIRARVTGIIVFDYELIISTTPINSEPIIPFFSNPLVIATGVSVSIVAIISVLYFKRRDTGLQKKEISVEPVTPIPMPLDTTPFYLKGPKSLAMLVVFSYGLLNIISGLLIYSLFREVYAIGFLLGGFLICSHIFTKPDGEFVIYGHLIGLALTIVWLFVGLPSAEIPYVILKVMGMTLGLVSSGILILRNWYGPFIER